MILRMNICIFLDTHNSDFISASSLQIFRTNQKIRSLVNHQKIKSKDISNDLVVLTFDREKDAEALIQTLRKKHYILKNDGIQVRFK